MGYRAKKPFRWFVQRDIQVLIRTFPSEWVSIYRGRRLSGNVGQNLGWGVGTLIYQGEALVIPADGSVADYGLGQVENKNPQILVSGTRAFEQGDFVELAGRKYQVEFEPNWWHGFSLLRLEQFQQGR